MLKKITLFVCLAIGAVVIIALLTPDGQVPVVSEGATAELDEDSKDQLAKSEAISQIAAESTSIDAFETAHETVVATHETVAPPGFVPAPPVDAGARPPGGYSFTAYHEVGRGPMTADDRSGDPSPAELPEWMALGDGALADQASAVGRDWSFGWVKLAGGAELEGLETLLAAHGGEVVGQAGDLVRARLPGDPSSLRAIAEAESVAGMGVVPAGRKVTRTLAERAAADINEEVPVWITLMSDDPDGRWRRALKELGAEVGLFDPAVRSYAATIPLTALGRVSEADYVLAVESIGRVETMLEISAPAMGADGVRTYDSVTEAFVGTGGASVTVGVMDSGLNVAHPDISSNRRSICGANFTNVYSPREEDQDLWVDYYLHGTHVTGIVVGNGADRRESVGIAPLVQDIRFAKVVSRLGGASALAWTRAMDWFAKPTACGGDDVPRKALVINSSVGRTEESWGGRAVVERKVDASVWAARQLFVTAAGNAEDDGLSSMASAKNALSVGATQNTGDFARFTSHGPTFDGRLMPKVVGTGVSVDSAWGRGRHGDYARFSGTSMASPSVAGVAALVMDAVPELKEEPAALRARLMASAIKPDAFLGDATAFPYDNTNGPGTINNVYGLGKVSARAAVLSRDAENGWNGGSAAFDMDPDGYAYHDIVVPNGASRLDVVMTWDEPPAETISNTVLHDLDLWIDRGASCGDIAACGHYSSRSRIDNVEWVIVPNPSAGTYRLKVLPERIYGGTPRAGLAWTVIRGASAPVLAVEVDTDHVEVGPDVPFEVEVTVSSDAYVAAGANLRVDCRTTVGSTACDELSYSPDDSSVRREDGVERTLARDDLSIVLGEIGADEERAVRLSFPGQSEGSFRLHLTASGWNAEGGDASVAVVVGEAEMPAPVQRPPNDDFAMAMELDGMGGETTFDLVAATPGPGEPLIYPEGTRFRLFYDHPQRWRSLWYVWTAPEDGLARFGVARSAPGDHSDFVVVDVYEDGPLAGMRGFGESRLGGGNTFFAEEGETYRVRLSLHGSDLVGRRSVLPDLTLIWGPASQPENDHYARAAAIEGESGTVSGTNQGATTEPGELMGIGSPTGLSPIVTRPYGNATWWTSSVWYRWTAPATGDYRFSTNRQSQVVAAFTGDRVAEARMVSGIPAQGVVTDGIVFPATQGVEYHLAVASMSAFWSGADFELSWASGARERPGNDDFADALSISGNSATTRVAFNDMTVEHGEPEESGVRTVWWRWQPEADGRYTWLADRSSPAYYNDDVSAQMAAFAGDELSALEVVAVDKGAALIEMEMAFDATADSVYRISLGLPRDAAQTNLQSWPVMMRLGLTPENDDLAHAAALDPAGGSVRASAEFATTEPGEATGTLGGSSLWWTFEPEESSWFRFTVDGRGGSKLAIYRVRADGGMELVGTSRDLGTVAATVRVEAGERYLVRYGIYYWDYQGGQTVYGTLGRRRGGEFELAWGPSDPPALLRVAEHIVSGESEDDGSVVEFEIGMLAFNGDGTELYMGSPTGIVVFERDSGTGKLSMAETLADHPVAEDARLLWDAAGEALIVASCDDWLKFTPADGGGIEHAGSIEGAPCTTGDVLVEGDFAHHVMAPWLIETFRFDEGHDALSSVGVNTIPNVVAAALTADGENIYALTDANGESSLVVMERNSETGSLSISTIIGEGSPTGAGGESVVEGLSDVKALAVRGSHLFVAVGRQGDDTLVFDLADRAYPVYLGGVEFRSRWYVRCLHAFARHDAKVVDVACYGRHHSIQVGADGSVFAADELRAHWEDSFGNRVPGFGYILSGVASPDGRHLYLAGGESYRDVETHELLSLERVYD